MISKKIILIIAATLLLRTATDAQLSRPSPIIGAYTLNEFVGNSFDLYDNTNTIKLRVDALEKELMDKPVSDIDPDHVLSEISYCSNSLTTLLPNATDLIASSADMPGKVKDELKSKPLKIPGALIQLNSSVKAIKQSKENISEMLNTTIPAIKAKLKERKGIDADQAKALNDTTTKAVTQQGTESFKEMTTILSVDNIAYAEVQIFLDSLKTDVNIKSVSKTYSNSNVTFIIVHGGTSDELLDFIAKTSYGKKTDVIELKSGVIKLKMK